METFTKFVSIKLLLLSLVFLSMNIEGQEIIETKNNDSADFVDSISLLSNNHNVDCAFENQDCYFELAKKDTPNTSSKNGPQIDKGGELIFKISLHQLGALECPVIYVTPYIISPSGNITLGQNVLLNQSSVSSDGFIDLYSYSLGGKVIKIPSPEYGIYYIGVTISSQGPENSIKSLNFNILSDVIAARRGAKASTSTTVISPATQVLLRQPSSEVQFSTPFLYTKINQAPPL